jgi:hypothetical protein
MSGGRHGMSITFGKSISGKLLDFEYEGCQLWSVVPGDSTKVWGEYI